MSVDTTTNHQGAAGQAEASQAASGAFPSTSGPEKSPLPVIELPKGGGAIRSIGEKLAVNDATGAASLTIPIPLSAGRMGFGPTLSLSYNSSAGNGPFGFGWTVSTSSITRKTDKGVPRYLDADESDVFILSGVEDLAPVLDATGGAIARAPRTLHGVSYQITRYRPRIEGLFSRIERWTETITGISHWRAITRDNTTTLYGLDTWSRVTDPAAPENIFTYLPCRTFDDKGNVMVFEYVAEDGRGVDTSAAHEANRSDATRSVQRYLKRIRYGATQPYAPDWSENGVEAPLPTVWRFQVVFDYGDHAGATPAPDPDQAWPVRVDPFSRYRSGFEIRSYRRCARALMFHNVPEEADVGADSLVRSLDFTYSDQQAPADAANPVYTFLSAITQRGYRRQQAGYSQAALPPVEFEYSVPRIQPDLLTLDPGSTANLPEGIEGPDYRWVDLDGEGLAGVLSDVGGAWVYKRNSSAANLVAQPDGSAAPRARFDPARFIATLPSRPTLDASQRLMDLSADGRLDVVALSEPDAGYFERTSDFGWAPLARFAALPQLDWTDRNVTFVDLTGDGLADVFLTEDGLFTLWPSRGAQGFDPPVQVRTPWDEERGPHVVLAGSAETIFLADMTGDGLSDLVRVRNGEVAYWPNLGYGRFGAKVSMDGAPRFGDEERYDPHRVHLADIDGSGTADLLYSGAEGVTVCFNQSGNAWAQPQTIAVFPSADPQSRVDVVDLLGSGTACLVWSSPLPLATATPLRYVDLMGGVKPHLLTAVRNNLGAETRVTYAPSTRYYVADREAGTPWVTRLHVPVQVVERVETFDWIGRSRFVARYAYHHGYFDGEEREFRGFGRVEKWDTEERRQDVAFAGGEFTNWDDNSHVPPVKTRMWFHTGAFIEAGTVSRHFAAEYWPEALQLLDSALPSGLTPDELREAYRALKGKTLRVEVYAEDTTPQAASPYSVVESAYSVILEQRSGPNPHAVFYTYPRETLTFEYERAAADPRVTHEVTLEVDAFGNRLRQVSVGYPRRPGYAAPEPALPAVFQTMLAYDQTRLHISATQNAYTNDLADPTTAPDTHRTPLPSETLNAELTAMPPAAPALAFSFSDLDALWQAAWTGASDVAYENIPPSDVDGAGALATPTRRIVARSRTLYRSDDLTALLALGQLQSGARPGESYHLALTPRLVSAVFGALVPGATLSEGGYVQLGGDPGWWVPSGRVYFSPGDSDTAAQELANAQSHFFLPRRHRDPFGAISRVSYDAYDLLGVTATDALNNTTEATNDYITLKPGLATDPNGNQAQVKFDALGFVTGSAVMGKQNENLGDSLIGFVTDLSEAQILAHLADPSSDAAALLGTASCRYLYDYFGYYRTRGDAQPQPCVACTLDREKHVSDSGAQPLRYRHIFAYGDGFGRVIQTKRQAAPGPVVDGGPSVTPRWVGSGWTIYNNKGKPVRTYEPFFTPTQTFEFAATVGVSTVICYDPPGRVVATLRPDNTWEKAVFDAWRQETWDSNDTVMVADPRTDADVGPFFQRLLGGGPFTSWHDLRAGGAHGVDPGDQAAQQDAAQKAAAHAGTQTVTHLDALGRACLAVADNGGGNRYATRTARDTGGRTLAVFDAAGRRASENVVRGGAVPYIAGSDLMGALLYHNSMDAGERRTLGDIGSRPLRQWDARGNAFAYRYDAGRRPTHVYLSVNGAPQVLIERSVYGEGQPALNLCTRLFRHYDQAGLASNEAYDFKGNLLQSARQVAVSYRQSPDWSPIAAIGVSAALDAATIAALDAATVGMLVQADRFVATTRYDALNRPIQSVTPHSATMRLNVIEPTYDESGVPAALDVWTQQAVSPAGWLDPITADLHAVTSVTYNARGQRTSLSLGNQSVTASAYDPQTFRVTRVTTTRPATIAANQRIAQDLAYAYDPVGDVTRLRDLADIQNVIYFNNQRVDPTADYTYDALYRLIAATGREHLGQNGGALNAPSQISNDDTFRTSLPQPGDGNAMGVYSETYTYDPVGNLLTMAHQVASGAWTRRYAYSEPSRIVAGETGDRLSATSQPGDPQNGPYGARYTYDPHGSMLSMPHLPALTWDERDRLGSSTRQVVNAGTPETTYYAYAASGERARKGADRQAPAGQQPARKTERFYLGGVEVYREYGGDGVTVTLQRETLRVSLESHCVAQVETRTLGMDLAPATLTRYQYGNHLESALLELDDQAQIITYEEYFPYGATSYQATRNQTDTPKRYRYTAKERDEETDLYYHGARYYAPWLGRWTACDPAGMVDGTNLYAYVRDNPVRFWDPRGHEHDEPTTIPSDMSSLRSPQRTQKALNAGKLRPHVPQAPPAPPPPPSPPPRKPPEPGYKWTPPLPSEANASDASDDKKQTEPVPDPQPENTAPALQPPYSLYGSWTTGSPVANWGHINVEDNIQVSPGSGGTSVTHQFSARLGLGKGYELGGVGNATITDSGNTYGSGGLTLRHGPTDLGKDPSFGWMGQASAGTGQLSNGNTGAVGNVSGSALWSKQPPDDANKGYTTQTDVNAFGSYTNAGQFGPGATAPHLLLGGVLGQKTVNFGAPTNNSLSLEGLAALGAGLGTLGGASPLAGARLGVGVGLTHADPSGGTSDHPTNVSAFSLNANFSVDVTSRGTSVTGLLTLTISDALLAPWAPR
jgi:RHS repeat-associated protein